MNWRRPEVWAVAAVMLKALIDAASILLKKE